MLASSDPLLEKRIAITNAAVTPIAKIASGFLVFFEFGCFEAKDCDDLFFDMHKIVIGQCRIGNTVEPFVKFMH